jgi:hypothetical protein|tara:strand:- start:338 stop:637 length:300 start_codon:yes stop_codon:yes gene_type:complete
MKNNNNLKYFFIKLISVAFAIILIINVIFNLFIGDKMQTINNLLSLDKSKFRNDFRNKIRNEINNGLEKDHIFNEEDKILLYKLYIKIKDEFKDIEKMK